MKRLSLLFVGLVGVTSSALSTEHSEKSEPFTIDEIQYQVIHYWETNDWIVDSRRKTNNPHKEVISPTTDGYNHSYSAYVIGSNEIIMGAIIPQTVNYWDRDINVTGVGNNAFKNRFSLISVEMPSVTIVNESAFEGCINLVSVKVGPELNIQRKAFANCSNLVTIEQPLQANSRGPNNIIFHSPIVVGDSAFAGCTKLTTQYIHPKVKAFRKNAFENCKSLKSVIIPCFGNDHGLGNEVFKGCSNIEDVYTEYPYVIPDNAFEDKTYQNAMLHVPLGEIDLYKSRKGWKNFKKYTDGITTEIHHQCDMNGDGEVNVTDLIPLVNMILGMTEASDAGDVNGDGEVNVTDLVPMVNMILNANY